MNLYNDSRLVPIEVLIRRLKIAVSDAEWEGNYRKADAIMENVLLLEEEKAAGNQYAPLF